MRQEYPHIFDNTRQHIYTAMRGVTARLCIIIVCMIALQAIPQQAIAQKNPKFNPERFERELEAYVVENSDMTAAEKAKFLPLYREMRAKQRKIFEKTRLKGRPEFSSDEDCARIIREHDTSEIKLKQIQRTYHNKFLSIMPAKKVLNIIKAEDEFHRKALHKAGMKWKKK